eukprot:3676626-Pyramimonas_sp.AAC.1
MSWSPNPTSGAITAGSDRKGALIQGSLPKGHLLKESSLWRYYSKSTITKQPLLKALIRS